MTIHESGGSRTVPVERGMTIGPGPDNPCQIVAPSPPGMRS